MDTEGAIALALDRVPGDLVRQMRWSFRPPLMVDVAAGITGLTSVAATFFVKEDLDLSAAFLAGAWFAAAALLAPDDGDPLPEETARALHTTMRMLGRFAIIGGVVLVAPVNILVLERAEDLPPEARAAVFARVCKPCRVQHDLLICGADGCAASVKTAFFSTG